MKITRTKPTTAVGFLRGLLLCAVLAGCGVADPPQVVTILQDDAVFLHRSQAETEASMDALRDLGVDWLRITAGWSVIAPDPAAAARPDFDERDPEAYPPGAWRALDRAVRLAGERGLRVAIDVGFWAPRWAVGRPLGGERERWEIDPERFANFAHAVARRYPRAAAFTVWNEPNHSVFWLPQWERRGGEWIPRSPHSYRAMLAAAVPAIRAAAPAAEVLIGATSSSGALAPDSAGDRMAPLQFLRELACVDSRAVPLDPAERPQCAGFAPLPGDGFSHHPYGVRFEPRESDPAPDSVRLADLDRLTELLAALHAGGRTENRLPIYITEYGYQTDPPDPTQPFTPADQARMLAEAERIARGRPDVRSTAQFLLRDLPERDGTTAAERWRDYQTGLRFPDGRPKPAERAFAHPLVVRDGVVWGLVRPGHGVREIRLRLAGRDPVELRTRADGTFEQPVDGVRAGAAVALDVRTAGRWAHVSETG